MVEYIAEHDDAVLDKYPHRRQPSAFEGNAPVGPQIHSGVENRSRSCRPPLSRTRAFSPCLTPSLITLPSPIDVPPVEGINPEDDEPILPPRRWTISLFAALAFKIMSDPFVGHVTYIRVLLRRAQVRQLRDECRQGYPRNASAACLQMHANKREGNRRNLRRRYLRLRRIEERQPPADNAVRRKTSRSFLSRSTFRLP